MTSASAHRSLLLLGSWSALVRRSLIAAPPSTRAQVHVSDGGRGGCGLAPRVAGGVHVLVALVGVEDAEQGVAVGFGPHGDCPGHVGAVVDLVFQEAGELCGVVAEHVVLGRIEAVTRGYLIKVHVRDDVQSDDQSGGVHGGSSWSFAGAGRGSWPSARSGGGFHSVAVRPRRR